MNIAKETPEYLDVSLGMHRDEKSWQLVGAIRDSEHDDLEVLEIGPGGGVAMQGLADSHLDRNGRGLEGLHLTTVELFSSPSEGLDRATEDLEAQGAIVQHLQADAALGLPFQDESIDIVNVSAVFHEIYSYSGGKKALTKAVQEIDRVTAEGGALLYRDIYPVETSMHIPLEQEYPRGSWEQFVRKFLPHYLSQAQHPYNPDHVSLSGGDSVYGGTMPAGLAREVQRHYLTFRDAVIRNGILGVRIDGDRYDEADWVRTENGHEKKIYIVPNGTPYEDGDLPIQYDRYGSFASASDFDAYVDQQLVRFFEDLDMNRPEVVELFGGWLGREGVESYVYGSASEVTDLLRAGGQLDADGVRYEITDAKDYVVAERDYYTNYLRAALGRCALADRKLMMTFRKVA